MGIVTVKPLAALLVTIGLMSIFGLLGLGGCCGFKTNQICNLAWGFLALSQSLIILQLVSTVYAIHFFSIDNKNENLKWIASSI